MYYDLELLNTHIADAARTLPGPDYYAVLGWVHQILKPATYIEIGVRAGASLAVALPDTRCVGIDPAPAITFQVPRETQVHAVTSDEYFRVHDAEESLGQEYVDFGFIDGLHLFEQSLRDFMHLEKWAGPRSLIAIHDCIPLNAITSQRTRVTDFYSGDVWKLAACLKRFRPDLQIVTIPTAPTGLCLVGGLNPASAVLSSLYNAVVQEYEAVGFDHYAEHPDQLPPRIPNTKEAVTEWLRSVPCSVACA